MGIIKALILNMLTEDSIDQPTSILPLLHYASQLHLNYMRSLRVLHVLSQLLQEPHLWRLVLVVILCLGGDVRNAVRMHHLPLNRLRMDHRLRRHSRRLRRRRVSLDTERILQNRLWLWRSGDCRDMGSWSLLLYID